MSAAGLPACRACGADGLMPVLSLGTTPLANGLLDEAHLDEPEATFPLDLVYCPACSLAQITESVPPEVLFHDYPYFSSFSDTMLRHAEGLAERFVPERHLGPESLVVELASNDGYLLQYYKARGIPVLGIEPAANIAQHAIRERQIPTRTAFFARDLADTLVAEGLRADLIHAHNVLAHVPDLNGFVAGIRTLLAPGGAAVIEAPYVGDMLAHVEFDTIYHEHLCYFSCTALERLFRSHGCRLADARRTPIHGGSLCITAEAAPPDAPRPAAVAALLAEEEAAGLAGPEGRGYRHFAAAVEDLGRTLRDLLGRLKAEGARIAAYGASAKGSTLLNALGIGAETLDFVADRSTVKQGRFTPGTHLPILPPEAILERRPDYVLLLTWNFREEILAQQAAYREAGGKFIVPVPRPEVV